MNHSPDSIPVRTRIRQPEVISVAEARSETLLCMAGVLEYSEGQKGVRLVLLMEVTPEYARGMGSNGKEYLFPLELRRRGTFYQILSVLRRMDRNQAICWNQFGLPINGVILVDNMRDRAGNLYHQGLDAREVAPILTIAKPYRLVQQEEIRVRSRSH